MGRVIWAMALLIGLLAAALGALGVWSASASTVSGPSLGRTIELAPVSGRVFVRLPGASHSVALVHQMVVPVGSRIDTTHGTVEGKRGVMAGVTRTVLQREMIDLRGGRCVCRRELPGLLLSRERAVLHASARGRFTTRGRYASATVRAAGQDHVAAAGRAR